MPSNRKKYDEEFKKRAVQLSYGSGRTVKSTAERLGVHESLLYRWRKRFTPEGDKTPVAEQEDELRSLRKKVAELEEENDLLKKASAYFAALHRK
jgi:transposase